MSGSTTYADLKRKTTGVSEKEEEEGEASVKTKTKFFWEYMENAKKIQEIELELDALSNRQESLEKKFPDLKHAGGIEQKVFRTKYFRIVLGGTSYLVPGKDIVEAKDSFKKKLEADNQNKEKQKSIKKVKT